MPDTDEDLPTEMRSLADMSALRLSALFKEWDAVAGDGVEARPRRAEIVAELTRYYPEDAGLQRIATLLGIEVSLVAHFRSMATGTESTDETDRTD